MFYDSIIQYQIKQSHKVHHLCIYNHQLIIIMKGNSDKDNLSSISKEYSRQEQKQIQRLTLKKKIADYQMHKVKSMSLQQLIQKSRPRQPIDPPSPTNNHLRKNVINSLKAAGFEHNVEQIAEKQMSMIKEAQQNRIAERKQMRIAPVFSQIKRGKLKFDGVLMLFSVFGSVTLTYIFYKKFQKTKEQIIKSRKYSPQVIQNISDDSPINIDSVSVQSIHYDNPSRKLELDKLKKKAQQMSKLKRQLDL